MMKTPVLATFSKRLEVSFGSMRCDLSTSRNSAVTSESHLDNMLFHMTQHKQMIYMRDV